AVSAAFKFVNNLVKKRSGRIDLDGVSLMSTVFSPKSPILAMTACVTESERNEQTGYMNILQGCMMGIRNPRAHEDWEDTEERALQLILLADHLVERVRLAEKP